MKAGDLIEWENARWLVHKVERATKSVIIISSLGQRDFIPQDLDETEPANCKIVCNPATDWPFVTLNPSHKFGKLLTVKHPGTGPTGEGLLIPFCDWIRIDPFQSGGPLFLNPELRLGFGHTLLFVFEHGQISFRIPKGFGTSAQRVARAATDEEPSPRTSFDRLLDDETFDDD